MVTGQRKNGLSAELHLRQHSIMSGLKAEIGGADEGPNPHELIEAALASCTILTVQMYADRKKINLTSTDISVKITSETKEGTHIYRELSFKGELSDEERAKLLEIADKCPIHRLLEGSVKIETKLL